MTATRYVDAPNRRVDVGGTPFAYRELGTAFGVPVIFLNHLAAVLDDWDPRVVNLNAQLPASSFFAIKVALALSLL